MAHYLAELYSPKSAWLALDADQRTDFFAAIGEGMKALASLGVEALALGAVEAGKIHAAPHAFFALWRFPDEAALDALLGGIAAAGWHDYFDTINAGGEDVGFAGHLEQLAALV